MDPGLVARYPFLPEAAAFVRAEGPPVDALMEGRAWARARSQGRERVLAALESDPVRDVQTLSDHEALVAVLGYAVARLLVSMVDEQLLTNRYATAEARGLGEALAKDNDQALLHVAHALGMDVEVRGEHHYQVPFGDFLRATRDLNALEWKLVNQTMDRGQVVLARTKVVRLCQEARKQRLLEELPLEVPPVVATHLDTWGRELTSRVQEVRAKQAEMELEGIEPEVFPPCIKNIITAIKASENVSHEGRFAAVSFLNTIGMDRDAIIEDLFSNVPDFARDITEYQVDHITGRKTKGEAYTPPGCSSLQTYGLCPMMSRSEDEWDRWCAHEKMGHPLTYYRWGLFKLDKRRGNGETDDAADPDGDEEASPEDEVPAGS